jgi:predicted dehydrogenase
MAQVAAECDRHLVEAFHIRYHPLLVRMKQIVESGELGPIRRIEAHFCIPLRRLRDIRYQYELGGGAMMDTGCYTAHIIRYLAGAEPEVVRAEARLLRPQVDRWMAADLRFADGRTARLTCSLLSLMLLRISAKVVGDQGELHVLNPILPHLYHRLQVKTAQGKRREHFPGDSTYAYQLRAFVQAVQTNQPMPTDAADGVKNMQLIDAIYTQAGLLRRGSDPNQSG